MVAIVHGSGLKMAPLSVGGKFQHYHRPWKSEAHFNASNSYIGETKIFSGYKYKVSFRLGKLNVVTYALSQWEDHQPVREESAMLAISTPTFYQSLWTRILTGPIGTNYFSIRRKLILYREMVLQGYIVRSFYWRGMSTEIKSRINQCAICQVAKSPNSKKLGLLAIGWDHLGGCWRHNIDDENEGGEDECNGVCG